MDTQPKIGQWFPGMNGEPLAIVIAVHKFSHEVVFRKDGESVEDTEARVAGEMKGQDRSRTFGKRLASKRIDRAARRRDDKSA